MLAGSAEEEYDGSMKSSGFIPEFSPVPHYTCRRPDFVSAPRTLL